MSEWLILSLIANVFLLGFYASKYQECEEDKRKVQFFSEQSDKWRKKYYVEKETKDW